MCTNIFADNAERHSKIMWFWTRLVGTPVSTNTYILIWKLQQQIHTYWSANYNIMLDHTLISLNFTLISQTDNTDLKIFLFFFPIDLWHSKLQPHHVNYLIKPVIHFLQLSRLVSTFNITVYSYSQTAWKYTAWGCCLPKAILLQKGTGWGFPITCEIWHLH